jgi:putative transposase
VLIIRSQHVNQKRLRRLWRQKRLQVRRVLRKRMRRARPARLQASYPGHIWAYDFVEDALADGTPLRILTVMDEFTREGLAIDVALTTSAKRVIGVLGVLVAQHGARAYLRSDNGAEFVATAVQTLYIERGKPWQIGKEERFNATLRPPAAGSLDSMYLIQAGLEKQAIHLQERKLHRRLETPRRVVAKHQRRVTILIHHWRRMAIYS